ncbi:hypothetical protein C8R48DRAFT_675723 [Suillus tomentosus]|nr:hypothetical protein C8R48DRAFT_675723 [Suillus tomentosus]
MISHEYWESYHEQLGALDLACHPTSFIPRDWALNVADIASEWVEQQFAAHIAGRPLVPAPPELDPETMVACGQLASVLAEAYQHPVKLDIDVIRYNEALAKRESGLNDSHEEALLAKFPPAERLVLERPSVVIDAGYRIILWYLPGALNWSVKGHECHGPPPVNPEDGFMPEVSATLKGDRSLAWALGDKQGWMICAVPSTLDIRLHGSGNHVRLCHGVMQLTNLGIELAYDPGVMVSYSGRLVRHGVQVAEGDRIVWAWFMRDSVHNYARTPRTEYAKYNLADFAIYHLAQYNQADFIRYRAL